MSDCKQVAEELMAKCTAEEERRMKAEDLLARSEEARRQAEEGRRRAEKQWQRAEDELQDAQLQKIEVETELDQYRLCDAIAAEGRMW